MSLLYLDNAATSFPKPPEVAQEVARFLTEVGANPGRSAHGLAIRASRLVFEAREKVAKVLGVSESRRVVFGPNATFGINLVLKGVLREGDHVVTTSMEHNAVARPLRWLHENRGVEVTVARGDAEGRVAPAEVGAAVRPNTRLAVVNHASNVSGTLQDLARMKRALGEIPLLVDLAQTAGVVPLHLDEWGVDAAAFTGHKGLLGPQGTGGLFLRETLTPLPLVHGGTGSLSHSDEQPDFLPDKYEAGTLNAAGLAGLEAGVTWVLEEGVETLFERERERLSILLDGLSSIDAVTVHGPAGRDGRVGVVSLTHADAEPSRLGRYLYDTAGICCRVGLHCAPEAHKTLGTYDKGTVRLAPGPFNTNQEMEQVVEAVASFEGGRR